MKSVYTLSEVAKIKDVERKRGVKDALDGILNATCLELLDHQGMSKKKTDKIMWGVRNTFEAINEGYLDIKDIKDTLKEDYDVQILLT